VTAPVPSHRRILVVDDNHDLHADFRKILVPERRAAKFAAIESAFFGEASTQTSAPSDEDGYDLESAYQGAEALDKVKQAVAAGRPFALAFVDMRMPPGWDGLETVERLWQVDPELQVVICTAYSERTREEIVERTGRTHRLVILKKPFDVAEIAQLACAMTEKWRASRRADMKMSELEALIAERTSQISAAKQRLEQSEQRYALAAGGANDGLWDWDVQSGRVFFSSRWKSILGLGDAWPGDTFNHWLALVHPHDRPPFEDIVKRHLDGRTAHLEIEHRLQRADGTYLWSLCRGLAVRDTAGKALRVAGSLTDISRRKETEDQLRRGAYYDRLTGLPNRSLMRECLERAASDFRADPSRAYAVLFMDFDRFKLVNDSLGHHAGDQLLIAIAGRLASCLQPSLAREHTLARLGGDEFVMLVRAVNNEQDALAAAQAIHDALSEPFTIRSQEVHASCSIGIAIANPASCTPEEILRDADTAMYHAKAAGRATSAVFDSSMRERAMARLRLENDLRVAIAEEQIKVFYQPIVCLRTTRCLGVEALARWIHPDDGPISPDRFIPIAEESGLIGPLGELVLRNACNDLKSLQKSNPHWADLTVNVNLSAGQFSQRSLVDTVAAAVDASGIAPGTLALEVTETTVMDDFEAAAAAIHRLRAMDVNVFMDDFGTGYSSLSCLKSLPISGLKLDRSFVAQLGSDCATPAIIYAIVTLAGHLRLSVVAEGIETKDQLAAVMSLECDRAQGYLFGKPMPLKDLAIWLSHHGQESRLAA
jgi:diguanylate cyclase (GGDEF)-like protein/PAS domain S-box-containing protein